MLDAMLDSRLPPPEGAVSGQELFRQGLSYATGLGEPRDLIAAYVMFALAARLGSLEARVYRKKLAIEMDLADLSEAERRARIWLPRLGVRGLPGRPALAL